MIAAEDILLDKIKKGDIEAFESFFKDLHPRLYAFSKKFIDDHADRQDMLQDIFVELWKKKQQLDIQTSLSGYIFRMMHNKCLNIIRHKKIHSTHLKYFEQELKEKELDYYNHLQTGHVSIFFKETEKILHEEIQKLPKGCREIFMMSRVEGMDNKSISEKLNISVRTVENQNYKALKILKEAMKEHLPFILLLFLISRK